MEDLFGNLFGGMFNGKGRGRAGSSGAGSRFSGRQKGPVRGADLNSDIEVSFDEAVTGSEKVIRFMDSEGTGKLQSLKVRIPAGIEDGKTIRLKGKGTYGPGGSGDLLLKVHVGERPGFTRQGKDIYTTAWVPFTTAVLGGEAFVPTVGGMVRCRIPAGTQSGRKIRLKGKGAPDMNHPNVTGDEYVTIQIDVPADLSPQALQKLKEFDELCRSGRGQNAGTGTGTGSGARPTSAA